MGEKKPPTDVSIGQFGILATCTYAYAFRTGSRWMLPDDNTCLDVRLDQPIALEVARCLLLREGDNSVGSGIVTEVVK
jgi:translation elongation factor EF-Tu-like GTPase